MDKKEILENFGKIIANNIRDDVIERYEKILLGTLKGEKSQKTREKIEKMVLEDSNTLNWIIRQVVDSTIYQFLWTIEQEEIEVKYKGENIQEISDGLCGEIFSSEGWFEKFSNKEYNEV